MTKTEKFITEKRNQKLFKKDWKIVLFFQDTLSIGKKVQVFELASKGGKFEAFFTDGLLSIDFASEEYSMINTGPCRYIAFNALHYAGSELPYAFATDTPIQNAPLNISIVNLSDNGPAFIDTTVFVTKLQKIKDNLYHIFTETDDYFIAVE